MITIMALSMESISLNSEILFVVVTACIVIFIAYFILTSVIMGGSPASELYYKKCPLMEHILNRCPSLKIPYAPPWWAKSGHVQTMLTGFKLIEPSVMFEREIIDLYDGGALALDWAVVADMKSQSREGEILLVIPGLTGTAENMSDLCYEGLKRGLQVVVFNKRGHGGMYLCTPKLQNFGETSDLRQAIEHIQTTSTSDILAIGNSAGAALLVSYLTDFADDSLICAAGCISPGTYDAQNWSFVRPGYGKLMVRKLKSLITPHLDMLKEVIDVQSALNSSTMDEFEERVYFKMQDRTDTMSEYWKINSPTRCLTNIKIPVLCLNSLDDPVCVESQIPRDRLKNEDHNFLLLVTRYGGHCGFLSSGKHRSWAFPLVLDFLQETLNFIKCK